MARKKKSIWKSKTVWINVFMAVISLASGMEMIEGITLAPWAMPVIILGGNVVLRFVTDSPIGLKDDTKG